MHILPRPALSSHLSEDLETQVDARRRTCELTSVLVRSAPGLVKTIHSQCDEEHAHPIEWPRLLLQLMLEREVESQTHGSIFSWCSYQVLVMSPLLIQEPRKQDLEGREGVPVSRFRANQIDLE